MIKKKLLVMCLAASMFILSAAIFTNRFAAENSSAGTLSDPLATKSYVDGKFDHISDIMDSMGATGSATTGMVAKDAIIEEVMAQVEYYYGDTLLNKYRPVLAEKGQIIIGGEGTEIILRSGTAVGYTTVENGLVNASDGSEVFNGSPIRINSMIIVPRKDNRGVRITSDDAWFIIKGEYSVV